jgi:hypothetical protein
VAEEIRPESLPAQRDDVAAELALRLDLVQHIARLGQPLGAAPSIR